MRSRVRAHRSRRASSIRWVAGIHSDAPPGSGAPRRLGLGEPAQSVFPNADDRIAVGEEKAVEVPVEDPGIRLAQAGLDPRGIVAEQGVGEEVHLRAVMPNAVGDRECAGVLDQESALVGTDRSDLDGLDARRDLVAEVEALDIEPARELMKAGFRAVDRAIELLREEL